MVHSFCLVVDPVTVLGLHESAVEKKSGCKRGLKFHGRGGPSRYPNVLLLGLEDGVIDTTSTYQDKFKFAVKLSENDGTMDSGTCCKNGLRTVF